MITEIIASILIIEFFLFMYKIGQAFVDTQSPLSKVFAIGSVVLSTFLVGLVFTT